MHELAWVKNSKNAGKSYCEFGSKNPSVSLMADISPEGEKIIGYQ
jgi:hypothetical protein